MSNYGTTGVKPTVSYAEFVAKDGHINGTQYDSWKSYLDEAGYHKPQGEDTLASRLLKEANEKNAAKSSNEIDTGSVADSGAPLDLSKYTYDASENEAYQQALAALYAAQAGAPSYAGTYDGQLDAIYQKIMNREDFKYDVNSDMLYQQYAEQFTRLGKMAMLDTTGQAAAMTGGYGNSYATTAGNQAYQLYLQQLNDVVPELYGLALDKYAMEGDQLMNQYSVTGDMADREYSRYQDALGNHLANLSYLQGVAGDAYDRGYDNWYNSVRLAMDAEKNDEEGQPGETHTSMSTEDLSYWYDKFYNTSKYGTVDDVASLMGEMENAGYSSDVVDSIYDDAIGQFYKDTAPSPIYDPPVDPDYSDWEAADWGNYFAAIREDGGAQEANEELGRMIKEGKIPQTMIPVASAGANGR